ncbi:MAG: patatin-like phospholipase family protein [Spirochaetia bacterium]|jgi:NTE family protein|nr:patatin-like phospholipase family protein [Spirochaetia bacterium]
MFGKKKTFGLALGGGAARGFAHIGVLKALDEAGLKPAFVAGTSVGSLIGALYCAGLSWQEIWQEAEELDWPDLVKVTMPTMGLVNPDKLEALVDNLVKEKTIEELPVPFQAVAVDLVSGKEAILASGPVGRAVRASCSIPGIFTPLDDGKRLLSDGGIVNNLPARQVQQMGADYVVSVDLAYSGWDQQKKPANLLEVLFASTFIFMGNTGTQGRHASNLLVVPELAGFGFHDMSRKQEMLDLGYQAMQPHLKALVKRFRG